MRAVSFRVTRILAVLLAAASLVSACVDSRPRGSTGPGTATPTGPSTPAVAPGGMAQIALLVPLSGENQGAARLGQALQNAARMAASEAGRGKIQIRVYDTAGDPGKAAQVAGQALTEGASLIVGPLFSANTSAVGAIASRAGVPVISFSTDSAVAGNGVYVSGYLPESEAQRIVGFARSRGISTFGVIYPRTAYGRAALDAARGAAGGGGIVAELGYSRSFEGIQQATGDFAPIYNTARPGGLIMPESGQGLRTLGAFLDYYGMSPGRVQYLGLGQWNSPDTLKEPSLRGGWFPAPDPDRVDAFAARYRASHGETPPVLAVLSYDAVMIAAQLLQEAAASGTDQPFDERALTRPQGFRGALGPLRFGRNGLAERGMAILEVGPGGFTVIDPAPSIFGAGS